MKAVWLTTWMTVGVLAALALSPGIEAQTSPSSTGTAPAHIVLGTRPAVDRSAPDKTWAALCAAVKAGDLPAFRAGCYNKNEIASLFMDAYSDTIVTSFQLANAVGKLGADGQAMSRDLQSTYTDLVKSGENRKTAITGDAATWTRTVSSPQLVAQDAMYFKKVGSEWLLDTNLSYNLNTADGRKAAEDFIASSASALKLLKGVIADINAGKITTVQQMRDRMAGK